MDICIMIEGQDGTNWPRWQRLARAVEDLGFAGLFRSDHLVGGTPPDKDALETWVSLTWLASHTQRIAFGPLVSPAAFRHPALLARMAAAIDDLSGGRLRLGLGAGWQVREHRVYGLPLLEMPNRFLRFEEYLTVVTHLLRDPEPLTFRGKYYKLRGATLLPRPARPGGPPVIIGGNGPQRTLPLVAKYANEWNCFYQPVPRLVMLNGMLDMLLTGAGRDPQSVDRTLMTGIVFAQTDVELSAKLSARGRTLGEVRAAGMLAGTPSMVRDQLAELADLGLDRVMIQWLDQDDLPGLASLAKIAL